MTLANENPAELAGIDRAEKRSPKFSHPLTASNLQPTATNRNKIQAQEASK